MSNPDGNFLFHTPQAAASAQHTCDWRIGEVDVDPGSGNVYRHGVPLPLERSGREILRSLVARAGQVVPHDELLKAGWPGRVVSSNSLAKAISNLRRLLGDTDSEWIQVVHGYGYRLRIPTGQPPAAAVESLDAKPVAAPVAQGAPASDAAHAARPLRWSRRLILSVPTLMAVVLLAFVFWHWQLRREVVKPEMMANDTIAVLPFRDASPERSLTALADGFAVHLRNHLVRVPDLRFVAPAQMDAYRDGPRDLSVIARELRANLIVSGDIAQDGERLRVVLRLFDARGRVPGWERHFERSREEKGALLDDLTLATLAGVVDRAGAWGSSTGNTEARLAFLRAATVWSAWNDEANHERRAILALEEAVRLDPNFAEAWLELGSILGDDGHYADNAEDLIEGRTRALAAFDRGLALKPNGDAGLYYLRSELRLYYRQDWAGALDDLEAAERLHGLPPSPTLLMWRARMAASLGRFDAALVLNAKAVELDSQNANTLRMLGMLHWFHGDCGNARVALLRQLQVMPDDARSNFYLALCDIRNGQFDAAVNQLERSSAVFRLLGTAILEHQRGNRDVSDRALNALTRRYGDTAAPYKVAQAHAMRGENDQAFQWLEHAFYLSDSDLPYLVFDPLLDGLRGDPRFNPLLGRLKIPADPAFAARVTSMPAVASGAFVVGKVVSAQRAHTE